jgi:thioredoxin reductase
VFGVPMESWMCHMPPGMYLKSNAESTNLFDAESSFTLANFCRENRLDYHSYGMPVKLTNFIAYGNAFQRRFVHQVEPQRLIALEPAAHGHELRFDHGESVTARHVVLATGVLPFRHTPRELASLPAALLSHSGDYGPLDRLCGKEVAVVGSGSSALDIAALLSTQGSVVTVVARSPQLEFQPSPAGRDPPFLSRALRRIYAPSSHGLGDGWVMRVCANAPQFVHVLPDQIRFALLSNTLGPSGGYCIREQIETKVTLKLGHAVEHAEERGGQVRLTTVNRSGTRETICSDHVVAATGYKVDLRRLGFLTGDTLAKLRMTDHTPILSSDFESSVPGLYFAGLTAARSFGPVLRFVMGAVYPARRLGRLLPRSLRRQSVSMSVPVRN